MTAKSWHRASKARQTPHTAASTEAEARFGFDTAGDDAVFLTDANGMITWANRRFERMYGLSNADIVGKIPHVVDDHGVRLALDQELWAKVTTPQVVTLDVVREGAAKSVVRIVGTASPIVADGGDIVGFIAVHREGANADEPRVPRYRGIFEASPVPTWIVDMETLRFLVVNEAAVTHYGYSRAEFLGMTITDIREEGEVDALKARLARRELGAASAGVWRHRKKDGTALEAEITTQLFEVNGRRCLLVSAQDLTEHRRLQEQFLQAQKLEAVGRLAGSIAHDFNNLLSVVLSYSALVKESLPDSSEARPDLEEIEKAAQRATALTRQLLVFTRRQVLDPRPLAVHESISAMSKMLERLLGEDIELRVTKTPDLWLTRLDPGHIDQVLMNLAVNARDAMPSGGTLVIDAANVTLDEADVKRLPGAHPGPHVRLSVIDTGTGMSADVQARAFEPFFTTKEAGKGTGLGLATVFRIVRQAGGSVGIESAVGVGTRFDVYLPRCEPIEEPTGASVPSPASVAPTGTETILLVEDDDQLRHLLEQVLRKHGYTTLTASHPAAARELIDQQGALPDLLLTDVIMPRMSGPKLAALLSSRQPGLRLLYMSGYAGSTLNEQGIVIETDAVLLRKPITPSALLRSVRAILDQPAATGRGSGASRAEATS